MRLDDNLYKPEKIDTYELDAYKGPLSFRLDETWSVPPSQIHLLQFYSGKERYRIYGIYIGDTLTIDRDTVIMYCHGNTASYRSTIAATGFRRANPPNRVSSKMSMPPFNG